MSPKLKVEINFTGAWVEVTNSAGTGGVKDYLRLAQGVSISEGKENETGDAISVGTCSLVLDNSDGRFSPNLSTSVYYPNVNPGAGLRVSGWVNSAWQVLFQGKIQSWSADSVNDPTGKAAVCRVSASDTLGAFPAYTLRQAADEVVRNTAGIANYWPLRDTQSPAKQQVGSVGITDNGAAGWAGGTSTLLPMEEGTDQHPLFKSAVGGLKLTTGALGLPAGVQKKWMVRFVLYSQPTAACVLLSCSAFTLSWDPTIGLYAFGSSTVFKPTVWPVLVEISFRLNLSLYYERITFGDGTGAGFYIEPASVGPFPEPPLNLVVNPTLTGGAQFSLGNLQVITDRYADATDTTAAAIALLGPRTPVASSAVVMLADFAGAPAISGLTAGETTLPLLEGRDAAEAMSALVDGMGARLVDKHDGTLAWIPFAPTTTPVPVPAGTLLNDLGWRNDSAGWCSDATTTWADGTGYTATRPDGDRKTLALEGVHASRALDRAFADWKVTHAFGGARCPTASVNLLHPLLTDAQRAALCAAIPGTRLTLTPGLAFMPASLLEFVEGRDVTIDHTQWVITFKLSPDIDSYAFTLDDATYGVLDAGNFVAA
ncbi:MAG TPA: hypothetical protein VGK17_02990 [Propionicimonas sp.]|jgi:hypothetical protein